MPQNNMDMEKKSSSVTLSDMEMFIFPELMYSLVLANIMSPRIWKWREDPWFSGLAKMNSYRRMTRLKQYIMDRYAFNLDLETWGLTTTERELARFKNIMDAKTLAESNALFGYEGDKYYFDIDIRRHFGLDKYTSNMIPYWKTETVEAMDAFRCKAGYDGGAGECVSLAALYAAAMFVVAEIPLSDIYLMATPLHSQNFIDINEGVLTNNRRLVTKNMWFNGTALSEQGRRALENEQVTIVTHTSGYIHSRYRDATIDPEAYAQFSGKLRKYLKTGLDEQILGNFIRHNTDIQKCFQVCWPLRGRPHYIGMEKLLRYEFGCPYLLTDNTRDKLMAEVATEDFEPVPLPRRIIFNALEDFVHREKIDIGIPEDLVRLKGQFASDCLNAEIAIESLHRFCVTNPRLPVAVEKQFRRYDQPVAIEPGMTREKICAHLAELRAHNTMADMAFYAYRDLNATEADPFLVAAIQRNPVCNAGLAEVPENELLAHVVELADESIYDEDGRLAQPDEVWNYQRGDGAEKAVLLANLLRTRHPAEPMSIEVAPGAAHLVYGSNRFTFSSGKNLRAARWRIPAGETE